MIGWDGRDGARLRELHRERHVAYVYGLAEQGHVVFAGPIRNEAGDQSIGSVIVLEAADLPEARSLVERDPYVTGDVFESITVNPFKQVIPEPK
ncbi:MAG: YciI family protein [Phycisphaerae bacterium]